MDSAYPRRAVAEWQCRNNPASVGRSPVDDGFQLLRQHGFQVIGPHINRPIFQHELKTVPYLFGGNGIAGGNINLQRSTHPVKDTSSSGCRDTPPHP